MNNQGGILTNIEANRFRSDEEMEVEHRGYIDDKYLVIKAADLDALGKRLGVSDEYVEKVHGWIDDLMLDSFIFVLRPDRDYHARVALAAYAESVRVFDGTLADDLQQALSVMDVPEVRAPD